jgi:serine/threonine protein kinase
VYLLQATFTDKKFKHVSNSCLDFMKRLLVRDTRYRMSTADALRHPFITGAPFYPRYASMQAADFDQYVPEEEKEGGALALRSMEKTNTILEG